MFPFRSQRAQHSAFYHKCQRGLSQHVAAYCFSHKRHLLPVLICLPICLLIFYLFLYSPSESDLNDPTSICSQLLDIVSESNRSLCSTKADSRGRGQRIISLAIFGPRENPIFAYTTFSQMITPLIDEARHYFPSWTIRLYAEEATIDRLQLTNLSQSVSNVDVCNVNRLPILGNVAEYLSGKLWRFLPALDPVVDFTSSRDLDSPLTEREQVVVEQFIHSSHLFLTLRDHPLHGVPVLGGLWTSAQGRNRTLFLRLFSILLDRTRIKRYALTKDQNLLSERIWPSVKHRALAFDSFTCDLFGAGDSRAFPTERPSRDCHLGCVRPCCQNTSVASVPKECPLLCRPKDHQDWKYC